MTNTQAINKIQEAASAMGTLNKSQTELLNNILDAFESNTHSKTIERDGQLYVWCNYHNDYEPAMEFDTRTNKKGKEVYRSSCRVGTRAVAQAKRLRNKANKMVIDAFKAGKIDANKMSEYLTQIENSDSDAFTIINVLSEQ